MLPLKPGDTLLYTSHWSLIAWAIRVKTWSTVSHIEVYIGDNSSISARANGSKVFAFESKNLREVWRPKEAFNLEDAMKWFYEKAEGQKYDWLGLFRFFTIGKQSTKKQFCSELATRFYRNGSFEPFNKTVDADLVSPGMFKTSARMELVWKS